MENNSKMIEEVLAFAYKDGKLVEVVEKVASDKTTSVTINNKISRNFSTVEDSLEEFVTGYMLGEGLITSTSDIEEIKIKGTSIKATIRSEKFDDSELVVCSDSGGGTRSKIKTIPTIESDFKLSAEEIVENMEVLKNNATIWKATGGVHVAGLKSKDFFVIKEDVSRHVAVDKVIGAGAIANVDFKNSYVFYSGRMPQDMLIKVARVGIPIIISNAGPAFSGYNLAKKSGLTMVGFARGSRFNVYTNPQRILTE
ncbi:MAG: formate dehydrogenase accessory sulfurtransferase FdhD [Methanobacteriaceae archaeon]